MKKPVKTAKASAKAKPKGKSSLKPAAKKSTSAKKKRLAELDNLIPELKDVKEVKEPEGKTAQTKSTKLTPSRVRVNVPPVNCDRPGGKPNDIGWHDLFLASLADPIYRSNIAAACRKAQVSRNTAYDHREKFPDFKAAWDEALQMCLDDLEGALMHRVTYGQTRKKFTKGGDPIMDPVTGNQYVEVEFNPTEVLRVLAAKRPEVWSEKKQLELSGKLTMTDEEVADASDETEKSLLLSLAGGLKGAK